MCNSAQGEGQGFREFVATVDRYMYRSNEASPGLKK